MKKTIKITLDILLGLIIAFLLMCYLVSNINQYYMLTFFAIPIGIHLLGNYYETKKGQSRTSAFIKYIFVGLLTMQLILALFFPEINHLYIKADRIVFPFLYLKPVEFSYWWILPVWMLLYMIKNKMLSLLLSITVFISWLLVYNLW